MKNTTVFKVLVGVLAVSGAAVFAQGGEGPWLVRVQAVNISSGSNFDLTGYGLTVNNRTVPEVHVSYFFNRNVALELMMMVPQESTLHLQYHFEAPGFKPYVGAGLRYAPSSAVRLPGFELDKSGAGAVLQLGVGLGLRF
jgi:outer membrane protein